MSKIAIYETARQLSKPLVAEKIFASTLVITLLVTALFDIRGKEEASPTPKPTLTPTATLIPVEDMKIEPVKVYKTVTDDNGNITKRMVDGTKYSLKYPDITPKPTKTH